LTAIVRRVERAVLMGDETIMRMGMAIVEMIIMKVAMVMVEDDE